MSNTLLITLRPFDYYFFGGEETFNSGAKGKTNFQVQSNLLPQQTGLLGLLRHCMLMAGYPIGASFNGNHTDFGVIKSLSPLMLLHKSGNFLVPAPNIFSKYNTNITLSLPTKTDKIFLGNDWQDTGIQAPEYDPKAGLSSFWVNVSSGERIRSSDLFFTAYHTGIDKQKRLANKEGDGGFFRHQFVSLHHDYAFAYFATFNQQIDISKLPESLPFGGDKRLFALRFEKADKINWDSIQNAFIKTMNKELAGKPCIVLLSDTRVNNPEIFHKTIIFSIMDDIPFRNLITPQNTKSYGSFTNETEKYPDKMYKEKETAYLLKRGSVLWYDAGMQSKVETLLDQPMLKTIGYNYYISFNLH